MTVKHTMTEAEEVLWERALKRGLLFAQPSRAVRCICGHASTTHAMKQIRTMGAKYACGVCPCPGFEVLV